MHKFINLTMWALSLTKEKKWNNVLSNFLFTNIYKCKKSTFGANEWHKNNPIFLIFNIIYHLFHRLNHVGNSFIHVFVLNWKYWHQSIYLISRPLEEHWSIDPRDSGWQNIWLYLKWNLWDRMVPRTWRVTSTLKVVIIGA